MLICHAVIRKTRYEILKYIKSFCNDTKNRISYLCYRKTTLKVIYLHQQAIILMGTEKSELGGILIETKVNSLTTK